MKSLSLAVAIAGLLLLASPAVAADPVLDLERLTVAELQTKMAAGQLTSVQATRAYIDRIAAVNARGPGLNAVRIVNPRALQDASLLDLERATGKVRGPLHGVPVLVKDNLDVAGLPTTAGSVALQNSVPDRDSTVVAKLRAAGAVILGKTNLSEFAYFMSTTSPSGYSSLGGQVLNPYDIDLSPERLELRLGLGRRRRPRRDHDRHGDQRLDRQPRPRPQGIVGLRPTIGLVSRAGILPISATQDTAGPMTRTVADAAAELQAIAGPDPEDPVTADAPDVTGLPGGPEDGRARRQADRRHQQHQRAVRGRDRRRPGARRDHGADHVRRTRPRRSTCSPPSSSAT